MKNIVGIRVYNRPFKLSTDETEMYIKKIASIVDQKIKDYISNSPNTNIIDAAILVALEAVDERQKAHSSIDNLRTQIKDYVDDAGDARLKCDEAQKQLRELKAKCDELEKEVEIRRMFNKKLETEIAVKDATAKAATERAEKAVALASEKTTQANSRATADKAAADLAAALAKAEEEAKKSSSSIPDVDTTVVGNKKSVKPNITTSSSYKSFNRHRNDGEDK
ncbi:MAG: cell division protein ZapA [Clostridiales bacterium]|nr:cell division protein ZapA [Clostridiales bacterium]